jgi:N-acetylmuramoyl-L-alanine amidase
LTFTRHLTLLLLAATSLPALAQETAPLPAPAPVVRAKPKPVPAQTGGTTPVPPPTPHLMVSHPVVKPAVPAKPAAAVAKPAIPKPAAAPVAKPAAPKPAETPTSAIAQVPTGSFNRTLVFLDPAHGGGDTGSRINDQLTEKDVTLALAFRIRSLLAARGFNVVMTRDSDGTSSDSDAPIPPLSLDDRAGIANHARPVACLLLHATASGNGVHLYTSELEPTPGEAVPTPWLTAQAAWSDESQKLAKQVGAAFYRAGIPLVINRASVRPVDSLTCPALVLELAPNGTDPTTLNDTSYQQHVAEAVAGALVFWQNQAQPPIRLLPPVADTSSSEVHP